MKNYVFGIIGAIGSYLAYLLGGWDTGMETLLIILLLDYITGIIVAGVFRKSKKTKSGGLNSSIGLMGIFKKVGELILVMVAVLLDRALNLDIVRNGVIIVLISNEVLSIIENLGLMGVPIPKIIQKAVDLLNDKAGEKEES